MRWRLKANEKRSHAPPGAPEYKQDATGALAEAKVGLIAHFSLLTLDIESSSKGGGDELLVVLTEAGEGTMSGR